MRGYVQGCDLECRVEIIVNMSIPKAKNASADFPLNSPYSTLVFLY